MGYLVDDISILEESNFTFKSGKDNPMYMRTPPKNSGNGISGYYKGNLFRSLLELEGFLKYERDGYKVRSNETKDSTNPEIRLPIFYDGLDRLYVPDLIVEKGNDKYIIEIKGKRDLFVGIFEKELREKFEKLGYKYIVIDHSTLRPNKLENRKNYRRLYDMGIIEIHSNKLQKFINYENLSDFKAKIDDEDVDKGSESIVI
jgi:hypothetical protein